MTDLVKQMRRHVASYKTLSPHRHNCLEMCDEIERLTAELAIWKPDTSSLGHSCPSCGRAYDLQKHWKRNE